MTRHFLPSTLLVTKTAQCRLIQLPLQTAVLSSVKSSSNGKHASLPLMEAAKPAGRRSRRILPYVRDLNSRFVVDGPDSSPKELTLQV